MTPYSTNPIPAPIPKAAVCGTPTHPLVAMLGPAVELHIQWLRDKGGPSPDDMAKAQESSDMLGERGDVLLCGDGKKGEVADLFNRTAHAVAILAFCPGGIEVFGQHFEAANEDEKQP